MSRKQTLAFDVNRILQFDLNRILRWDVGRALTRPVTNPVLKFVSGWFVGIFVFGLGLTALGITPTDRRINMLAIGLGVIVAIRNTPRERRGQNTDMERLDHQEALSHQAPEKL
jgi:hypothetical protein